jgi:hypothetical protein
VVGRALDLANHPGKPDLDPSHRHGQVLPASDPGPHRLSFLSRDTDIAYYTT